MTNVGAANSARAARAWLRARRRSRAANRLEQAYLGLLTVLVGGGVVASVLPKLASRFAAGPPTVPGPTTLLAIGLLWYAAVLAVAGRFGLLAAAPAQVSWLLSSPTGRRGLLWPTALVVLGLATLAGLLHGTLVAWALTAPLTMVVLAGGVAGLFVGGAATLVPTVVSEPATVLDRFALLLGAGAAVLTIVDLPTRAAAVVGRLGPWGWPQTVAGDGGTSGDWPFVAGPPGWLAVPGVAAVLLAGLALVRLDRVRLGTLAAGGAQVQTLTAGVVTLDLGIAARIGEERRWAARAPRRTGLLRFPGPMVALAHDLLTLRRSPERLALAGAALLPPVLSAGLLGPGPLLAVVWPLCGLLAAGVLTGNVRRDHDLPALGRLLGVPERGLLAVRSIVPVAVATCWSAGALALVAGAFSAAVLPWLLLGGAAGPALAAGALRAARRGAVRHDLPPIVTPMGWVPTAPLHRLVTAVDLGLLCTVPTLLAVVSGDPAGWLPVQLAGSLLGLAGLLALAGARIWPVPR
ncbi:DUF6297 family protein [Plantactinospora sp. B5E13]|uniref:DUF6297 family protein n=1 Tax=Plantactinospora sp. B5E13 TaxID=3153758 RepID=UPI00325EE24B